MLSVSPLLRRAVTGMAIIAASALTGCESGTAPNSSPAGLELRAAKLKLDKDEMAAALDAVRAGNEQSILAAPSLVPAGAPLAPFIEARLYAIANIAMHDALNAVVPKYERYADNGPLVPDASAATAVLTAAHDAIVGADAGATVAVDLWYASAISPFTADPGYAAGVALGQRAAAAILALRATDGVYPTGGVGPYTPGTNPGDYQFTFPFNTPFFDFFGTGGFADASNWGAIVTPFVMTSTSQFRAAPPYGAASNALAVQTAKYTRDFNEIKALGCNGCTARTPEQTEIALFWVENSPTGWNRIARTVAEDKKLDAFETARLFALLQMGEFDAYTASLESKYYYNFWRPVSAVALAGSDGNPNTSPEAGWEVVAFPTPPVPDYPSAHSTAGGAAAQVIEDAIPGAEKKFSTTSGSLPGVTRSFKNVADAADENALSRVLVGYHFREATKVGVKQGRDVGKYVVKNALQAIHGKQ
ncbi:MAG TPA: vanadium-dependent haloperoxidase [Gemmatimonadaceae bacterium]|nr:vanadium-dependent haloperoxidase [Gemmatimonadaceae bacterium]